MSDAPRDKPVAAGLGWRVRETRYLHRSAWFDVRQDGLQTPDGADRSYTYIEHPGSVFVVPVLADGRIVLIRSYRYTLDCWCWEVPAGGLGDKPGLTPEAVAAEELAEETGMVCDRLVSLGAFWLGNGQARHLAHFFLALRAASHGPARTEALEIIDRRGAFLPDEAIRVMMDSEDVDGDSLLAVLLAQRSLIDVQPGGGHG